MVLWLLLTIYVGFQSIYGAVIQPFECSTSVVDTKISNHIRAHKESDGSCLMLLLSHRQMVFAFFRFKYICWKIIIRIPSAAHKHFACCRTWNSCVNCTSVEPTVLPNLDGDECIQYLRLCVYTLRYTREMHTMHHQLHTQRWRWLPTNADSNGTPFLTHQIAYVRTLITHCSIMRRLLLHFSLLFLLLLKNIDYNGVFYDRIHTYFNYHPLNVKDQKWRNWSHFDIPMPWLKSEHQLARAENNNKNVSISFHR